jgi:hypothetical protein
MWIHEDFPAEILSQMHDSVCYGDLFMSLAEKKFISPDFAKVACYVLSNVIAEAHSERTNKVLKAVMRSLGSALTEEGLLEGAQETIWARIEKKMPGSDG